jgi:hypothetical protein
VITIDLPTARLEYYPAEGRHRTVFPCGCAVDAVWTYEPTYDRRKQTFVDVALDSPFHEPIEQLAAMELISGYDLPNGKREFRQGVSITRAQAAKVVYGALRWLVGALGK